MSLVRAFLLLCSVSLVVGAMPQRTAPSVDTLLSEAGALVQAGRLQEAETATRKILTTHPRSAEAHSLLGVILDQRGLTAEAEKEYGAALRLKPNLVSALSNLGVLLAKTNRPNEAIAKFEEVLRIDQKHQGAIFNLGALYAARGDYKRAVPLLEKAAGQDPRMLFTVGLRLAEAREYADAVRLFQRTNELRPQTFEVL
jgi:Flp pilus assembly protein TadD